MLDPTNVTILKSCDHVARESGEKKHFCLRCLLSMFLSVRERQMNTRQKQHRICERDCLNLLDNKIDAWHTDGQSNLSSPVKKVDFSGTGWIDMEAHSRITLKSSTFH